MEEQVEYTNLIFHEKLGEGAFGTVSRVTFKKPFKGLAEAAAKSVRDLRKEEVEILSKLDHPNIVSLIGFYQNGPVSILLLEYAKCGSLHDYLSDESQPLTNNLKRKWAKEAALAIQYLHKRNCLHRDIKPKNCLLFKNILLKLCDFGLAREVDHSFTLSSAKGTYQFMAPEIINTNEDDQATYSRYTDTYAYGMLLLQICTRKPPFHGKEYHFVVYHVGNGDLQPDITEDCPKDLQCVMKQCWDVDPRKRPTIDSILEGVLCQWTLLKRVQPECNNRKVLVRRVGLHPNGDIVCVSPHHLHLLNADGMYKMTMITTETDPEKQLGWVRDITVSPQGYVSVVDGTKYVKVFDENGKYFHSFSTLMEDEDPNTKVILKCIATDMDGHTLVYDRTRKVITLHKCPSGEIVSKVKCNVAGSYRRVFVSNKKQILFHFRPSDSLHSKVVAKNYLGKTVFSFKPKIEDDETTAVYPGGIVCDTRDNILIALHFEDVPHTGHIHKYSPTGEFLECIAQGLYKPYDLMITPDGTSLVVANVKDLLIYGLK